MISSSPRPWRCEKVEIWRYPRDSMRWSARSTQVEPAPQTFSGEEQNAYGPIFFTDPLSHVGREGSRYSRLVAVSDQLAEASKQSAILSRSG